MVTYFDNTMTGAPVMSGSAGAMLGVLDACLITGFGLQSVSTLTVVGTVATAALPAVHGLRVGTYVRIAGATPAGLNGDWPVTSVTSQGFTFTTAAAAGVATGSITSKHAPLGWAKEFSGTNLAAYRSADVTGTRLRLYVDDSATTTARVIGYDSMTDIATGINPFPTTAQASGGLHWLKSSVADATARPWVIIGDSRTFYIYVSRHAATPTHGWAHMFGDYNSVRSGDPYAGLLTGHALNDSGNSLADIAVAINSVRTVAEGFLSKSYTGTGGSVAFFAKSAFAISDASSSATSNYSGLALQYPNGPDNGLITAPKYIFANSALRGDFPGLLNTPQLCQTSFNTGDIVTGTGSLAGRRLMCLRSGIQMYAALNGDNAGAGVSFIDITGPWR